MKKFKEIENEIIIVGGDHYNALGVIRSLGECGIKPIFILLSDNKENMSSHSKYIKKLFILSHQEEKDLDEFLINNFSNTDLKPIIIPTGDPVEKYLDIHFNKLNEFFILPNIANKEKNVLKHMDKLFQYNLTQKYNIPMAKTYLFKLDEPIDIDSLPNKIIIKPYISADGNKSDIRISEGKKEIEQNIEEFKNKGYKSVLIQEFLDYEMEYAMMGFSNKGVVTIPGINSNNFIFPSERGNTSYAEMFPLEDFKYDISKIVKMIEEMNYTGLFEIEMFLMNNKIYFNEMNFRNSANLYGYKGANINYVYLYLCSLLGYDCSDENTKVTKHYHFCIEPLHFKNIFEKRIGFFRCIYHILSSTKCIFNMRDIKPTIKKYKYAIKKRICKHA